MQDAQTGVGELSRNGPRELGACVRRGGEYVFVYLPDWWWLVGCLGICVGRRAGADGGVCVAVSWAASLSTSVSGRDKGRQQDTHKQHIVVELMLIEIRHLSI